MYMEFYGLAKKPFNMTPDPAFLFLTTQHREALAGLTYAILERKGFLVLSGMSGAGKTTLLSWVLKKLPSDRVQSSVILNPTLTREEFLEMAMLDFGITDIPASKARRLWVLQNFLLQERQEGRISVLIVDEAHQLSVELLEEIRLLGNLECADEKLIQILLIGQSELDEVMNRPELWQLKQRVSVRLAIKPLSVDEVEKYMEHRWTVAGGKLPLPFEPDAIAVIKKWSQGIPRMINSISDSALTLAFAEDVRTVTAAQVEAAVRDLQLVEKKVAPAVKVAAAAPAKTLFLTPPGKPEPALLGPVNGKVTAPQPAASVAVEVTGAPHHKQSVLGMLAGKFGWHSNGKTPKG